MRVRLEALVGAVRVVVARLEAVRTMVVEDSWPRSPRSAIVSGVGGIAYGNPMTLERASVARTLSGGAGGKES